MTIVVVDRREVGFGVCQALLGVQWKNFNTSWEIQTRLGMKDIYPTFFQNLIVCLFLFCIFRVKKNISRKKQIHGGSHTFSSKKAQVCLIHPFFSTKKKTERIGESSIYLHPIPPDQSRLWWDIPPPERAWPSWASGIEFLELRGKWKKKSIHIRTRGRYALLLRNCGENGDFHETSWNFSDICWISEFWRSEFHNCWKVEVSWNAVFGAAEAFGMLGPLNPKSFRIPKLDATKIPTLPGLQKLLRVFCAY